MRVWDRFVRVFHWALVASFLGAYLSTESIGWVHKGCGYATLALVAARVVWGFVGSEHARFANFVPDPQGLWHYAQALLRQSEPRHLGHNPAGSVMIVFLLLAVAAIGVSGWMLTLDAFWGNETVEVAAHAVCRRDADRHRDPRRGELLRQRAPPREPRLVDGHRQETGFAAVTEVRPEVFRAPAPALSVVSAR